MSARQEVTALVETLLTTRVLEEMPEPANACEPAPSWWIQ